MTNIYIKKVLIKKFRYKKMPLFDNQECQLNVDRCVHMEETNHSHFYILYLSLFLFISLLESTLI